MQDVNYNPFYEWNGKSLIIETRKNLGAHIGFGGDLFECISRGIDHGMYSIQFFLGNPKSLKRHIPRPNDIISAKKLLKRFPTNVFSHFPYISNLVGSIKSLAWNGDDIQDGKTNRLLKSLEYELSVLSNFERNGVVIHPGNYKDRKKGISNISKSINKINFTENSKLILENAAGQGNSLATSFQEIKEIIDGVDEKKRSHIGVCIDTAHIHGYGSYNLSEIEGVKKMFREFDEIIGMKYFSLLHLNDSKVELGAKLDIHQFVCRGKIWKEYSSSLSYLLDMCEAYNIPIILETGASDMLTLAMI